MTVTPDQPFGRKPLSIRQTARALRGSVDKINVDQLTAGEFRYPDWHNSTEAEIREDVAFNNTRRAGFALRGLVPYGQFVGGLSSEPPETLIQDLIGDLMHLADSYGLDFAEIADSAGRRYNEEVGGEV